MEAVLAGLDRKLIDQDLMQLACGPGAEISSGFLEENFHKSHQAGMFELDSGDFGSTLNGRFGQAGQEI